MEEKKHENEQPKSKRYLAFYIIGLFSVALVIILLSYLTQLRADRELANMNNALAQKDTTVQGVQEKMVALQDTVEEQAAQIEKLEQQLAGVRTELEAGEEDDLTALIQQRMDEHDAYSQLIALENAAANGDDTAAANSIDYLERTYGAGRLDGTAENAVFTGTVAERYLAFKAQF